MKKISACILAAMVVGTVAFAQDSGKTWWNSYAPGIDQKVLINAGLGWVGLSGGDNDIPPLSVSADFKMPIKMPITLGGIFMYWRFENAEILHDNIGFGVRGMYHFNFVKNLDVYAGLMLGYAVEIVSDREKKEDGSFLLGIGTGARYFFTKNIGAYLEIGVWYPIVSLGLAVKF